MSARRVVVRAPAKVNLGLAVHGRRPDGFHEIETLLLALELADRIVLEERAGRELTLAVRGPAAAGVPVDETNLALRAARAVLDIARARGARGLHLELEKHIPVAAGLGGGSSDAAAAAFATALLVGLDPDGPEVLAALAALGSDCAFFLAARRTGLARCTGRGEEVEPLARAFPWSLVLLTPAFGCTTAEVYGAWSRDPRCEHGAARARMDWPPVASLVEARAQLVNELRNELQPAALRVQPALVALRGLLEEHEPGAFQLSGSGSSWFGLFADPSAGEAALDRLRRASQARRYALRGSWVVRASGRGVERIDSPSQFDGAGMA